MNKITSKEVNYISDLLIYEEQACKKARLYGKTLLDKKTAGVFNEIADNHQKRFNTLLELL